MKIKSFLVALLLVLALVVSAAAQARTNENSTLAQVYGSEGREVPAPTWSAACMTDQGPSQCDEPMWIYGGRGIAAGQMSTIPQKHDNPDGRK
jgi:hypothetical protein